MARIDYPRVMGHRGAAAEAPENTLVSIRKVAEAGVPWVEIDAMLTGDDVPVLFHDDTLDRTTGRTGLMAETTFAEVQGLDAGRWFGPAFAGEPLPSLDDAVALICALGLGLNLEIKPSEGRDEVTAARVIDRLEAIWPKNGPPLLISSFQVACLEVAQARHPAWPRALVTTEPAAFDPGLMARLDCVAYHSYHEPMTAALAEAVRSSGYALACYTVNEVAEGERLFSLGVDCVITDYPGLMQRAFG